MIWTSIITQQGPKDVFIPFHITYKARPGNICNGQICSSSFWVVYSPHSSKSPLMSGSHTTRGYRAKPPPELHSELLQLKLHPSPQRPTWSRLKILPHLPLQGSLLEQKQVPLAQGLWWWSHRQGRRAVPSSTCGDESLGFYRYFHSQQCLEGAGCTTLSSLGHDKECDSQTQMQVNARICPNPHTRKVQRCGS